MEYHSMKSLFGVKLIGIIASVLLVAACTTGPNSGSGSDSDVEVIPGTESDLVQNVGDRAYFDFNSYSLTAEGRNTLQAQAAWLKMWPSVVARIEGNCDERGTREYNLALGDRRANAVRDYLITLGIASQRVSAVSYGKERPYCGASTEECWQENRNGTTSVVSGGAGS
jgi:peptidoglycan-associated lipoprotein